ncbi:IQ domain-containing protein E-like isoform X5 [Acropora millepora]|uniref:IQ domain-containing protein E-like isoform X5 n=1 Tax=Acropora millepora TaxID=45264 RepID=UPI001CF4CDBA|nr:IQ domain-containing protein E-like isoform X5 [Acropora millepora]
MPIPGVTVEDVDAYSDVSNGSTISVDSVASEDNERMPRPPTGGSKRSKSAQSQRSRVAKSPYSGSQFKVSSKEHAPKPSARNLWITAMRNGTASLSTENRPMKTLAGSRATTSKLAKSGSRTQHFRDLVVIDNLKSRNHVRSASLSASEPQLMGAGPAYKPQEDYYDEVIELKKVINALKAENNIISTKLRRVEGENILKDRKMEDLLNQRKQPEDVRRTLTDKKGDTSAIVNSLKQKLHGVERTVKDKETELSQLKKTLKMTNIEELQIQSETYYQEIQRLQLVILEMQQAQVHDHFGKSSPSFREHKGKPSTMTLKRLADENDHLKAENRGLKKDLLSAIETSADGSKVPLKADYADMSRGQLLAKIHELEEKILKPGEEKRKGSLYEEDKEEGEKSRRSSSASSVAKLTEGRVQLKGSTSQKLAQLQEREVELLEEREKQREVIERLKEDRAHYRLVADDLRMQLQFTQEELDTFRGEKGSVENQRRSSTASSTGSRKLSVKEVIRPPVDDDEDGMGSMLKEFQQKRAAKTLQREWRGYQGRKQRVMEEKEREEENRQNEAAATLQKNWRRHRERAKEIEVKEKEEAITEIQAALRGQAVRSKYIEKLDKELELTDRDDAVVAIQSAMRAHLSRKKHVEEPGYELISRDFRTRGSSSNVVPGSEPNDDEGLVSRPTNFRQPEAAMTGLRRSSLSGSRSRLISAPRFSNISEQSEDEDIRMHKSSRSRLDESPHESAHRETQQEPKTKTFKVVDSDDDDDDDVVIPSRRTLDTGVSQKRPSLSSSTRGVNPPSRREEKARPALSRSSQRENGQRIRSKGFEVVDSDDDEDNAVVMPSRRALDTGVSQKRPSLSSFNQGVNPPSRSEDKTRPALSRSSQRENGQRIRSKGLEVVDSDDDEDDAVVMPSRRALDTGVSHQRPSLSLSNRERSPPGGKEDKIRPGLSRTSGKLTASRDVEKSEVDSVQSVQRPGLSRSTRPLSAKKSRKDRFDRAASDEEENKRVTGWRQSGAPAGSEDDSDGDGVVVMGRKAKTGSGGAKTGGRSSLTRKSPATAVSAPPKRETFSDSLDNFFSSSKDANNKKPVRKTSVRVNEDDDNDDDDDDDDIVVSSSSKHKSRQKEAPRKDSRDSVADLWATSEKKGTLKKGKSSSKSPKNTWNPDFEFGKPPRRPESQLDEMF